MKLDREKLCWRLLGVAVLALALMGAATPFTQASPGKHTTIQMGGRVQLVRSGSVDMSTLPVLSGKGQVATTRLPANLSPLTPAQQKAWAQAVKNGAVRYPQVTQRMAAPKIATAKPVNTTNANANANTPSPNFDSCGYAVLPCTSYSYAGLTSVQGGGGSYPSTTIGSNPSYVLEGVNSALVVYRFNGTVASGPVAASSFFSSVLHSGYGLFNPQVFWDASRLHWIIVMEEYGINGSGDSVSYLDVAVSKTQNVTLNPATQYYVYQLSTNESLGGSAGNWCDNPTLGSDYWGAWISCNAYDAITDGFVGNLTYGLSKNALYTGSLTGFYWADIPASGVSASAYNLSPASEDGTPDAEFLIASDAGYSVSNDPTLETCAFANTRGLVSGPPYPALSCVSNSYFVGYTTPNYASEPGKPNFITPGTGAKQVIYKGGAIGFAMTTAVSSSQDGIFWAELQPQLSGLDPTHPQNQTVQNTGVRQQGVFAYAGGGDAYMPTYYLSSEDDGVLLFTYSSSSIYPAIGDTGRRASDAPDNMGDGGQSLLLLLGGNTGNEIWGIYGGCSLDTNLTSRGLIWCGAEYVNADPWDTYILGLRTE